MAGTFEQVTRAPAGVTADGTVIYDTVWTGKMRRPESVPEWCAQRVSALGHTGRSFATGRAVVALLEAGEGFDVKAAGRDLDEQARHGVLTELIRLLALARQDYSPAAPLLKAMHGAWVRAYGDREPLPRRPRAVQAAKRPRPSSLAETGVDPDSVRASWERLGAARLAAVRHWGPWGRNRPLSPAGRCQAGRAGLQGPALGPLPPSARRRARCTEHASAPPP